MLVTADRTSISSIQYPASSIQHPAMRKGAIVLCGGKSSRMGRDKATLPFGPELMLQRVVRLLSVAVEPKDITVVAAPHQRLPKLPAAVKVARDSHEFRGPLQGLATGLGEMGDKFDAIYATACDVPLLAPSFVTNMFHLLSDYDVAVPFDGENHHSLAAVYRPQVLPHIQMLLDADRLRPRFLFDLVRTREVPVDDLRNIDPQLATLENLNHLDDYLAALAAAGFSAPGKTGEPGGRTL